MTRLSARWIVIMFAVFILLSGVSNVKSQEAPRIGGTLRVATAIDPWVWNGYVLTGIYAITGTGNNIYEHLLKYGPNYEWRPLLAQSWESTTDGKNWTFHLIRNATWSDGVPFSSADVAFTYRLSANMTAHDTPPTILPEFTTYSHIYLKDHLVSVTTPDAYTVVFGFDQLTLLNQIVYPQYADNTIIPRHIFEGTDMLTNPAIYKPIGTGPFVLKDWVQGSYYVLGRNENYWGTKAYVNQVICYITATPEIAAMKLEAGEVDLVDEYRKIPLSQIPRLRADSRFEVDSWPYYTLIRVTFNFRPAVTTNNPWILNPKVRQALHYAIDKQGLVNTVFFNVTRVNPGPIPVGTGWLPQPQQKYEYNVTLANQLLDEAGWPVQRDGWRFDMGTLPTGSFWGDVASFIKEMWRAVHVKMDYVLVQDTTFAAQYASQETGIGEVATATIHNEVFGPDPSIITLAYHSHPEGAHNAGFFSDSQIDQYLEEGQSTVNDTERIALYVNFADRFQELVPAIHLAAQFLVQAWSVDFVNVESTRPWIWGENYAQLWWVNGTLPDEVLPPPENISALITRLTDLESAFAQQRTNLTNQGAQISALQNQLFSANNMTYAAIAVAVVSMVVAAIAVISAMRTKRAKK